MRKTLTVISIATAALSLAACKKFWEHDAPSPAVATAAPPATDPTATPGMPKPAEPASAMAGDAPAAPAMETATVPEKK